MNQNENNFNNFNQYPNQNYSAPQPNVQIKNTKSKFWTFIFALIPGAGQMYQGLMKKGFSLMLIFLGVIGISAYLYQPLITILLPIIWFYSFFDVLNRISYSIDELKAIEDKYILNNLFIEDKYKNIFKSRNIFIGWAITLLGIYLSLYFVIDSYVNYLPKNIINFMWYTNKMIPKLIIPVVCIFIGFKLIKVNNKDKKAISEDKINEDII